jgi:hypothetical protein
MGTKTCTIEVKVLSHWLIQKYSGDAILAAANPRFVVAVLIANTKALFPIEGTGVELTTHRVAFFAVDSLTKVFAESDIVGKEYRLNVQQLDIGGKRSFLLNVVG